MRRFLWIAVAFLLAFDVAHAQAAQGGDPQCQLSASEGRIVDTLTGLRPLPTTGFKWYVATLTAAKQQLVYFRPSTSTWTVSFPSEGPGTYRAGLFTSVDNQKGPAKFTQLATACTVSL